jgi:2,3-dihydroxybiphenyl 1,2-dioxygenase
MTGITELGYVRFGVSDLSEWRDFAAELLATEIVDEGEAKRLYLRTDNWHHRVILEEDGTDDLIGAGMRVAGVEEFDEMQHRLKTAGINFEKGSAELAAERRVLDILTLADPAGNPIEIFHGPQIDAHKPFHPSRGMFGKFVTGDGGVGHMILKNAGLESAYQFYAMLGMRGGVEYKVPTPDGNFAEILFMHCNSRDHSVAFGLPSTKNINHLMLEVDNIDDVFHSHELVQASKYPVMISLGKHANDHMFSFYFATPSEWLIEIGTSGRPATHQSEYYTRDMYGHVFDESMGSEIKL